MPRRITIDKTNTTRRGLPQQALETWTRERIHRCRKLYEADENPLFAWDAYLLARRASLPIPEWALEYFDLAAENLQRLSCSSPPIKKGRIVPRLVAALGFVSGGVEIQFIRDQWPDAPEASRDVRGRFNPLARDHGRRDLELSEAVWVYMQSGKTKSAAVRSTAAVHHVSTKTVSRAIDKFPLPGSPW